MNPTTSTKRKTLRRQPSTPPSAVAVERERAMWGAHPDPAISGIEERFYRAGFAFLSTLYGAAFGVSAPRKLMKALPAGPSARIPPADWGALAKSYEKVGNPLELRNEWAQLIDRLVSRIFPWETQEQMANAMAIQVHWLARVRARTEELALSPAPDTWAEAAKGMSRQARESMEWTKTRALEGCRNLAEDARKGLASALVTSKQAGEGSQALARRCFDGFADLNRDWRRLSLTETASATFNGTLAAVDPNEEWEAEWVTAVGACPWCLRWKGMRFRVVSPNDPSKNPDTDIWVGKTNIGRAGAATKRTGERRSPAELWQACQPCHPNCSCGLVMRRITKRQAKTK